MADHTEIKSVTSVTVRESETRTATLLFDAECRFVRVPAVDKPTMLQPSVAEQFKKFFQVQLAEEPAKPQANKPAPTATPTSSASPKNP